MTISLSTIILALPSHISQYLTHFICKSTSFCIPNYILPALPQESRMLKLDGDFSLEAEKRKKPTKSLAAFQLKIIVYVDLTSTSFYYHTSLGTSFHISSVFSYRQLDLKSNDEHCNGKYRWNSTNGYPSTSTTCQTQQADQGSRTTVYAKSAKECLHYTIFMLLKVCLRLTSLDGVVMRRYKKDFSAGPSAGSDSRPLTLFSSFEL